MSAVEQLDLPDDRVDAIVEHAPHGVAGRRERAPHVQDVVAERRELLAHARALPVVDVILELVDPVVDPVRQLEVALGDVVDEVVDDHPGRAHMAGLVELAGGDAVERLEAGRALADGEDEIVRRDDIHLAVEHGRVGEQLRHEEHAEDVVAVSLERRTRVVSVPVRREQLVEGA